jgi:hypothetical protein
MEHSENQSLGDAINAAAAQLPIIETASLRENVETAWDALFDIAKGSAAAEVKAAFEHIHSARDRVADALTELGLVQEALREYNERTGYGGGVSTASTSSNATAAHVEHATIDPGMPIAPEKSVPQPVVLSPEQQAAIAIDEDYEKVVIQKITDDGDGRW